MTSKSKRILIILSSVLAALLITTSLAVWLGYRNLKGALLAKASDAITSAVGQRVRIGDVSVGFPPGVRLENIAVENPAGFPPGHLVRIRELRLSVSLSDLLRGRLRLGSVRIVSPELALMRDGAGRLNVSDGLRAYLSKKSSRDYQVDDVRIEAGSLAFAGSGHERLGDIELTLNNLSARPGTKTLIKGSASYGRAGKIGMSGWAYLKDEPKRFRISLSSGSVALGGFRKVFEKLGIDPGAASASARIDAEGDTANGFAAKADITMHRLGSAFLRKGSGAVSLNSDAYFSIPDSTVTVRAMTVRVGDTAAVRLQGAVRDLSGKPSYDAAVRIEALDLSALNPAGGITISGTVVSDTLHIRGDAKGAVPSVSGSLQVRNAAFRSKGADLADITAQITFMPGSGTAGTNLNISAGLAAISVKPSQGSAFSSGPVRFTFSGSAGNRGIAGKCSFDVRGPKYGTYALTRFSGNSGIDYRGNILTLTGPAIDAGDFRADARLVKVTVPEASSEYALDIKDMKTFGGRLNLAASGKASGAPFPLDITLQSEGIDLGVLSKALSGFLNMPYSLSGTLKSASFAGRFDSAESLHGSASLNALKVTLLRAADKRPVLKGAALSAQATFDGGTAAFRADAGAGDLVLRVSGAAGGFMTKSGTLSAKILLPEVRAEKIRESLWEIFPDSLLYAGLGGSLASELSVAYAGGGLALNGTVRLANLVISGENNEYAVGPVSGTLPVAYGRADTGQKPFDVPVFERSDFETLVRSYSERFSGSGFSEISIGSVEYGFRLLEDIRLQVRQQGKSLHIGRFSANIFGGKIYGSAAIDGSEGFAYRAGILVKGLSMAKMCEDIEPIKGYLSGKADGIASFKGSGAGIPGLIGKADFWTYGTKTEKTKISKEFLRKVGGPSVKSYLRDRPFDKGVMGLYIKDGFVIFNELEISNRNIFGIRDLSVKVAPLNNRISIDHLLWTMVEAAHRAKAKQ